MPHCPRCHQAVDAQAVRCGHCGLMLKAFGHPGIPLHRAAAGDSLCATCTYNLDDSCTFPQRPAAQTCTLYQSVDAQQPETSLRAKSSQRRYGQLLPWLGLLAVSLLIAWIVR
ncbi:MAG: zinc ribbon domain-containing protein [Leptolyngbyaceae cyanobacterium]